MSKCRAEVLLPDHLSLHFHSDWKLSGGQQVKWPTCVSQHHFCSSHPFCPAGWYSASFLRTTHTPLCGMSWEQGARSTELRCRQCSIPYSKEFCLGSDRVFIMQVLQQHSRWFRVLGECWQWGASWAFSVLMAHWQQGHTAGGSSETQHVAEGICDSSLQQIYCMDTAETKIFWQFSSAKTEKAKPSLFWFILAIIYWL